MLRPALLLLCLAVPLAVEAQTTNSLTLTDTSDAAKVTFGKNDCTTGNNDPNVFLTWTLTPTGTTGTTYATGDTWRLLAIANSDTCPTADANLIASPTPTTGTVSGRYPATSGTIKLSVIRGKAGVTCSETTDQTIFLCVALRRSGATTYEANVQKSFKIQLQAPLAVTGLTVTSGNNALNASWTAPSPDNNPAATKYRVTATTADPRDTSDHAQTIGGISVRIEGLLNSVLYTVTVVAISEGGNESPAVSDTETPFPADDFFTHYSKEPGANEQGGCAGGPAGLLSLLGLAAALRAFRRRS